MKLTVLEKPSPVPKIKGRETQLRKRKTCYCSEKIKHNQSNAKQRRTHSHWKNGRCTSGKITRKMKIYSLCQFSLLIGARGNLSSCAPLLWRQLIYMRALNATCRMHSHLSIYIAPTLKSGECQVQTISFFARRDK